MKNLLFSLIFLSLAGMTFAQKDIIGDLFTKYSGAQGVTVVTVSGDMLNMMMNVHQQNLDTVLSSKFTEVRILALEKGCDKPAILDLRSEVYDKLDKSQYKEMLNIKQSDENAVILMKESQGRISEILIIAGGGIDNALIQVKGDMLLSEMAQFAGKFPMKGFEQLKNLEK